MYGRDSGSLCPENKDKFEKISLSRRTVTHRVELIDEDMASELQKQAESFKLYSLALDESNDIKDTAQLRIFIRGINDSFEITEVFLTMESLKEKMCGQDIYDRVSAVRERMNLPWRKLANVTTDGSPNLTGKNVGLLKRIQDKVKEETPDQDVIFLHCIIHQESLCKSVLKLMAGLSLKPPKFVHIYSSHNVFPLSSVLIFLIPTCYLLFVLREMTTETTKI